MTRRRKFVIAGLVAVVLIVGSTAYVLLSHSGGKPITISELKSLNDSGPGETVSVMGEVSPGSIEWDPASRVMRFALIDSSNTLEVVYRGVVPDDFRAGEDIAVEGWYTESGIFEARSFTSSGSFLCNSICH